VLCPFCAQDNDRVIDSRSSERGEVIRRRRQCLACQKRFTTYERVEKARRLVVVKRDGTRDPFNAEKILAGIQAACGKRPIPEVVKSRIVEEVEEQIYGAFEREVPSATIGELVAARLRDIDPIAYLRYASEYHRFRTLDELTAEIGSLASTPRALPNQRALFEGVDEEA